MHQVKILLKKFKILMLLPKYPNCRNNYWNDLSLEFHFTYNNQFSDESEAKKTTVQKSNPPCKLTLSFF